MTEEICAAFKICHLSNLSRFIAKGVVEDSVCFWLATVPRHAKVLNF